MSDTGIINPRARRVFMWLCVAALLLSSLPLYAISFYNHPYYDDYGFSADVRHVWLQTGSIASVMEQAVKSAATVRRTWQGTYTGTLLSNIQPGVFSERLYFTGTFILLTAFIICFAFFFYTLLKRVMGCDATASVSMSCLLIALLIQLMPDVGEAFYWFNGGIGNVFIYSALALSLAVSIRLMQARNGISVALLSLALLPLMVLLGGGSYGGGLIGLCVYACTALWLFIKRSKRAWIFLALFAVFLACFLYSVSAPGNAVRSIYIGKTVSPLSAVAQALYYGMAQIGGYIRLPIIALSLFFLPAIYGAASRSRFAFAHPWLATLAAYLLFCVQLAPPIYAGVFIGGGRIVNTYFISFAALWVAWLYYMAGCFARRASRPPELTKRRAHGLALLCASLLLVGCLGFQRDSDKLPGVQNLSGVSAALSIVNGEARTYHGEMSAREALLNDASQPVVTLSPCSVTPAVFMKDLLSPDAAYDSRPSLCLYYGKEAILIEGNGGAQ